MYFLVLFSLLVLLVLIKWVKDFIVPRPRIFNDSQIAKIEPIAHEPMESAPLPILNYQQIMKTRPIRRDVPSDSAPLPVFNDLNAGVRERDLRMSRSRELRSELMPMPVDHSGIKYVTVRVKVHIGEGESIAKLPEEEAICEICCRMLEEDTSVLSTKCGCSSIPRLTHEKCRSHEKCEGCEQVFHHTPVTVSRILTTNLENPSYSTYKRFGGRLTNLFRRK